MESYTVLNLSLTIVNNFRIGFDIRVGQGVKKTIQLIFLALDQL
jgi:hypothetical protein